MNPRPKIAISSCLLGQKVRYDGEIKQFPELCYQLQQSFDLLAICPETEIGLPVPRPPVQLCGDPERPDMKGRDDPSIDITEDMYQFCSKRIENLKNIHGYVFKSRSPSCGLKNIPVFHQQRIVTENHAGLFAEAIMNTFPGLPVADETMLESTAQRNSFIKQVLDYYKKH